MSEGINPRATGRVVRETIIGVSPGLDVSLARRIAALAGQFDARVLIVAEQAASAQSLFALLSLGVRLGDHVQVSAVGPDAGPACDAMVALLGAD